jgi:hypothetical protein
MNTNVFVLASSLSDHDLLDRLATLAVNERSASAELVAHLAALDARPSLYAARGYGSLFAYCTEALRLSEDAACTRIAVAKTCRRFPAILASLESGVLSLTSIRLLHQHLTTENCEAVLARASGRSRRQIEALVAELAPKPDVPSSVRKLPVRPSTPPPSAAASREESKPALVPAVADESAPSSMPTPPPVRRPIIENTSPERYRVQFTIGKEGHDRLRRLQALLRREIPDGDAGVIVERALALLLEKVESAKVGAAKSPRPTPPIRPGTDRPAPSRNVGRHDRRAVWSHDGARCAFVSRDGHRCTERAFLEFHHVEPYALGGPTSAPNLSLRCRRHNQYEAELVFGPRRSPESDRLGERREAVASSAVIAGRLPSAPERKEGLGRPCRPAIRSPEP